MPPTVIAAVALLTGRHLSVDALLDRVANRLQLAKNLCPDAVASRGPTLREAVMVPAERS